MVCKNCGYEIPENENICPNCGCDCDKKDANNDIRTLSDASDEKTEITMPDADWRKEYYIGSGEEQKEPDENQHVFPTMTQRGSDEGLPDMDLGKSTRYYAKKRQTPVEKTRWEKILLKYRPLQDAAPEEFESAAKRNEIISIFLNIFSVLCFLSGLTSALGIFFSVLSIMFADYAVEYYKKDVVNQNKNYYLLKGTCRLLFWMNVIMFATAAFYWAYAYVRNKASFFGMSIIKWIYLGIKQALN